MKIVYCHNYYRHRGGEDISFESDLQMLREEGHTVIPFTRDNHALTGNQFQMAARTLWNRQTYKEMLALLQAERPDVLHCNNLFPQVSVSVYHAAKKLHVPVVQALRNYRTFCANSFLFRDGGPCNKCLGHLAAWYGIRHKCYRDSFAASSIVAGMQLYHRLARVHKRHVNAFFTPTAFARQIHIEGGFDPDSIFVRSNFLLPDLGPSTAVNGGAIFVGRLSKEKGIDTVIDAWTKYNIQLPLLIVGDGPEASRLHESAAGNSNIRFRGQLNSLEVLEEMANARFLIMPSLWYETFGRTIAEAFSRGTPVVASRLGAMIELVEPGINGYLFEPGSSESLHDSIKPFLDNRLENSNAMRRAARLRYETFFTPKQSYRQLLKVYRYATRDSDSANAVAQAISNAECSFETPVQPDHKI